MNTAMQGAPRATPEHGWAPHYVMLWPTGKRLQDPWFLCLDHDLATLLRPDNSPVLEVHREEAARYMRFSFDLRWGRTLTFAVVPGAREYAFHLRQANLAKLLDWLPQRTTREKRRDIQLAGLVVACLGLLHLALPELLSLPAAGGLLAVAFVAVAAPARWCYALNGSALLLAGLWALFLPPHGHLDPRTVPPEDHLALVLAGSVLVLAAVAQFSRLSANRQLRVARRLRDRQEAVMPRRSDLVRKTSLALMAGAGVCAVYAGSLGGLMVRDTAGDSLYPDLLTFAVLAVLMLVAGAVLRVPRRAAYAEARVSGQLLASLPPLALWTLALNLVGEASEGPFHGVFSTHAALFMRPYVWGSLVLSVVIFNRGFTRAMERELEEHRLSSE